MYSLSSVLQNDHELVRINYHPYGVGGRVVCTTVHKNYKEGGRFEMATDFSAEIFWIKLRFYDKNDMRNLNFEVSRHCAYGK